jgi:hypothetical protein
MVRPSMLRRSNSLDLGQILWACRYLNDFDHMFATQEFFKTKHGGLYFDN